MLDRLYTYQNKLPIGCEFVFDVETDGANEVINKLYGMGFCFNEHKAFYIPWRLPDGSKIWSADEQIEIINWLEKTAKDFKLIGHNISFDVLIIENELGLSLVNDIHSDTILQKHTIEEEPPFALKELAVKELRYWADKAQETLKEAVLEAGGKWTKAQKDMYLAPTEILAEYCCWDVLLTLKLYNIYEDKIIKQGLHDLFYKEEVMDLYREVTIPMKRRGVRIDEDHFNDLNDNIEKDIAKFTDKIQQDIEDDVYLFTQGILDKEAPIKRKGNFPKMLAEVLQIPLPVTKAGKTTLSAKAIEKQRAASAKFDGFYAWLLEEKELKVVPTGKMTELLYDFKCDRGALRKAQEKMFFSKSAHKDKKYVFNLASNDHLAHLLFKVHSLPIDPKKKTESGKPQVNEEVLSSYSGSIGIIDDLLTLKKLNKLHGTYIQGILDRQIDGRIYASLLQFGTTSGRYASRNPNLQNLPRVPEKDPKDLSIVEKYTAAIRKGFIADEGCSFIDADYSALEPRCFSHVSGDAKLRELWAKGEDMYSRISIDVFSLDNVSANPSDPHYLKKVDPPYRQKAKVFCLAVPYGAEAGRISQSMNCSKKEAQAIINQYLGAYPGLKSYMNRCNYEAKTTGMVKTEFGRIRHLPQAKSIYAIYGDNILDYQWAKKNRLLDVRRKFKNALNNAKNFPIQGMAGHIINRAMIAISRRFKKENIPAYICLMVHDQVIVNCPKKYLDKAAEIVQDCMENTTKISVDLIAEPEIADNMAESH
jgi:DNA polymerase I-like protein with 3'-5' exonuclease and polymerase domains